MLSVKSPISRIGGKYYLTSWITQYIPEHVTYVEPFCGAGHLLFSKESSQVEILNDIDGHLINFFRVIQHPEKRRALIERLNYMPYSRSLWQEIRSQWKQGALPQDEIERAAWWYYLNSICFGGDFRYGGFKIPSVTGRNPIQSFRNSINTFDVVSERLRNVCIENLPYAEAIRRYDSRDTLFYCDPPYLGAEGYYGDSFGQDDHFRLSDILHSAKAKVMLSHYECDVYDRLYSGWNKFVFKSFKGAHKSTGEAKPKTQEVLYCNFEPQIKTRNLFQ